MPIRLHTLLLAGFLTFGTTASLVSCKDYDDDISELKENYESLSSIVSSLQAKIDAGSVITSLDPISNGVVLTLSDGKTYTITNGKNGARGEKGDKGDKGDSGKDGINGKDAVQYAIGVDGYWYADGVNTGYKAIGSDGVQGPKGDKGDPGASGSDGVNGKDGATWTIGDDGYWYLDGVRTQFKAVGTDGEKGEKGDKGDPGRDGRDGHNGNDSTVVLNGDYYVPNDSTGRFDRYVWNEEKSAYDVIPTGISYLAPGTITAVKETEKLTIYGVRDSKGNDTGKIVISLAVPVYNASVVSGGEMNFKAAFTEPSVFGQVYADNPIKFFASTQSMSADVLVLVNPSTAVLRQGDIHLINTAGQEQEDIICTGVRRYTGIDTRAVQGNLWRVTFSLRSGASQSDLETACGNGSQHTLYAISIRDVSSTDNDSRVTTGYDVTVNSGNFQYSGAFTVNGTSSANIHNRYLTTESGTSTSNIEELVWPKNGEATPSTSGSVNRPYNGYTDAERDNRQEKPVLDVKAGQAINISYPSSSSVKGFYVMLDYNYAVEDGGNELSEWNGYSYDGVGIVGTDGNVVTKATMFTGTSGTIRVNRLAGVKSDIIGLRVYAVNVDGTLVDPDGMAFYVRVTDE